MAVGASPGPPVTHPQRPGGFAALRRQLAATGISPAATLVVLEATGNYWAALAATPHTAGYRGSVINPLQAHHFAKAQLRRAKTDPLDARNLAQLAAALQPAVWTPPPAVYHDAAQRAPGQRLTARDVLVTMRQQARNQRHALLQWPVVVASVRDHLDGVIALFDARIADLEGEIAAWLLVSTMNFTLCATPAAATVGCPRGRTGLAPMSHTSGSSVRGQARIGHGGQSRLRTALYMATLAAVRHNPELKGFSDRLRAARKLLHLAWALVTKRQRDQSNHRILDPAPSAA